MPLPNSRVIPDGWEAHHAPTAEGAMTAACVTTRPTHGTFDPVAGGTDYSNPGSVYAGPCRVQAATRFALLAPAGEKPTTTRHYLVGLPLAAPQHRVNDVITIAVATDAALVGMRLIVTDVKSGSLVWERDLVCEVYEPTAR